MSRVRKQRPKGASAFLIKDRNVDRLKARPTNLRAMNGCYNKVKKCRKGEEFGDKSEKEREKKTVDFIGRHNP